MRARDGTWQYPAFQVHNGRLLDDLVDAFWTVAASSESEWTAASWCVAPDDAFEGSSPAQWAARGGDSSRLARIARQDAARLSR
jgi:hypothetical protein